MTNIPVSIGELIDKLSIKNNDYIVRVIMSTVTDRFVDVNGDWKHYKYDGRPMLGAPFETAHPEVHEEMKTLNNGVIE